MKNKEPVQYRAAGGVRYEFKRKRVKNINLRVRADGSVAVSAPLGAPLAHVPIACWISSPMTFLS
jgi:predicted metal-dependent hydrolase